MQYFLLTIAILLCGCHAEKFADDLGVHMELEIDKPSDIPPAKGLLSDKEVEEMIRPKQEVEEKKG